MATGITPSAQLSIEVEVPKSFVTPSPIFLFSQKLSDIPIADWTYLSLFLPLLTLIVLIIVGANRFGGVGPAGAPISDLPSRLPPAMVGILLNGKLSTRDIAATFIDLAIRGHLVIRQFAYNDFRFSRLQSTDQLAPFEATLLSQIFGPLFDKTSSAEISLLLSKEVFSTRVSSAFLLAYNEIGKLGYFKTNPLAYHLRYQIISIVLFIVGLAGFVLNIIIVPGLSYVLLAWAGMMISALVIYAFALGLPVRTLEGDRELARWLSLRSYLTDKTEVPFTALVQEQYQRLLPYSIVMEAEVAWTRRFFEMPFAVPDWYLADNIGTIDQFANSLFPLSGYLSHSLSATVAPSVR